MPQELPSDVSTKSQASREGGQPLLLLITFRWVGGYLDIHGLVFNTNAGVINPFAGISRFYTELTLPLQLNLAASSKSDLVF